MEVYADGCCRVTFTPPHTHVGYITLGQLGPDEVNAAQLDELVNWERRDRDHGAITYSFTYETEVELGLWWRYYTYTETVLI